ncbi:hypothetical protein NPIL_65531 [Nephila pilipes]|uniref:Uncharacterized protein n=1 Tax=Nephila pilipes TaxID=299642 RepID=A0A8X6MYT9_NEPPI|nr:hypothetical protein NPIL_65531 [Nephila pilipes]
MKMDLLNWILSCWNGCQRFTDEKEENGSQLQDFVYPKFDKELSKNNNSNSDVKETQKQEDFISPKFIEWFMKNNKDNGSKMEQPNKFIEWLMKNDVEW